MVSPFRRAKRSMERGFIMSKSKTYFVQRNYDYDSSPQNPNYAGITESEWRNMIIKLFGDICNTGQVELMAFIFHDKDPKMNKNEEILRDKDGNIIIAPLHVHAFVEFKTEIEQSAVRQVFGATSDENCKAVKYKASSSRYLTHMTEKAISIGKYVYDMNEVYTFNCNYREIISELFWGETAKTTKHKKVSEKKAYEIADELAYQVKTGELRKKEALDLLEEQAGYHWRRKLRESFNGDQREYIENKVEDLTLHGRENRNIYIMGTGGIGKSNLARKLGEVLADNKGLYVTSPLGKSKTPDALNHYTDEAVAIFNEISPRGWSLDEFLACFDMYEYAPFPSRNENKHFIGHTSIFTNSISPLRFAKDLLIYSKGGSEYQDSGNKRELNNEKNTLDKYWQVRRRFSSMILLLEDEQDAELVHGHVFNLRYDKMGFDKDGKKIPVQGSHVYVGSFSYRNEIEKEPEITKDTLSEVIKLLGVSTKSLVNAKRLSEFMQENGIVETLRNDLLSSFIDEVVNECVWDLLPTQFLYALYRRYRDMYYPSDNLLSIQEFKTSMEDLLDGWEFKKQTRTGNRMSADEPLISEYGLLDWMNKDYNGTNPQMKRNFKRKDKYSGFVRV